MNVENPSTRAPKMNSTLAVFIAWTRRARYRARQVRSSTPVQMLMTALLCMVWVGVTPMYVHLISTYDGYVSAQFAVEAMAIFGGIAVHLWPTQTSPWRTIAWAIFGIAAVGGTALGCGAGHYALTLATITGFLIIIGRANSNARRIRGMVSTWRNLS